MWAIRSGSGPTVVFSFFKKDPKDARKGAGGRSRPSANGPRTGGSAEVATRPLAKPIGRPLTGPTGRPVDRAASSTGGAPTDAGLPDRERARNYARQTAAKIDQIEAEMARDLGGNPSRGAATLPPRNTDASVRTGPPTTAAPTTVIKTVALDPIEENSELFGGNIDAIEINTSRGSSVIDEAAILFANGQIDAAEALLRAGLRRGDLGASTRLAWQMLLELLNQRGDRPAFEQLSMEYALRFEHTPPAWTDDVETPAVGAHDAGTSLPAAPGGGPGVRLPESVDAGIVGQLEQLRGLTAEHASVQLDVSDTRRVDIAGAALLLRVIGAFRRSHRELTLVGAANLAAVLSRAVESGRRDDSDALWMLLLEVLRMLGKNDEFEEAAIQYCITFEVSPPSWEPPPSHLKVAAPSSPVAAGTDGATVGSLFALSGTVDGAGEPWFGRMIAAARNQPQVVIDCGQLRRLTYSAGSALLGTLRRIRQGGSNIELRNVSALVAALLHLLGITSIASVQSRYG